MPKTLNKPNLPYAAVEISPIKPFLETSYSMLKEVDHPTRSTTLQALKTASHAHVICHGYVTPTGQPLTYLILHDSEDESRRFQVRSILSASMPRLRSLSVRVQYEHGWADGPTRRESTHRRRVPDGLVSRSRG